MKVVSRASTRGLRKIALAMAICVSGMVSQADPATFDASLSGQVVDDTGVPVTNITVFAVGQIGLTNTFSAVTDTNGYYQMGVLAGEYKLQLDRDPVVGVLSRGLVSPVVLQMITAGIDVTNADLVAKQITGSITVKIVNGGASSFRSGLVAKNTINLSATNVTVDSFDSTNTSYTNLYSTSKYGPSTNYTYDTNLIGTIYDTNLIPVASVSTNLYPPTNFIGFHYDETLTNHFTITYPPEIPITNIEVNAELALSVPKYVATAQRTDTNGTAVLYVCGGEWVLHPDCQALDEMNLDCQINHNRAVTVTNGNVAVTLPYYTNAPFQIVTNMVTGTNGLAYNHSMYANGGYYPFTWKIVDGTLPPGLNTNSNIPAIITGVPTQEGIYTFTAQVTDNMQQTLTTNVSILILPTPPPRLTSPRSLDLSQFQLQFPGASNRNYSIQFTTDLTNWTTLTTTNAVGSDVIFVDTNAGDAMRIYRAVQEP
jgi:hypothetical protein